MSTECAAGDSFKLHNVRIREFVRKAKSHQLEYFGERFSIWPLLDHVEIR